MAMIRKATDGSRPSVSAKERYVHNFYSTSVSFSPARRSLAHNISFERRAGDKERNEAGISAARYHLLGHETKRYDVLELRHMIHVRYGVSLVSLLYAESSWLCCTRDLQQSYHLLRNEAPARRCPSPSESGPQTTRSDGRRHRRHNGDDAAGQASKHQPPHWCTIGVVKCMGSQPLCSCSCLSVCLRPHVQLSSQLSHQRQFSAGMVHHRVNQAHHSEHPADNRTDRDNEAR